jgi:hypothetical protein
MKLWLDDVRSAPPGWEWATSVEVAIKLVSSRHDEFQACSLDHDLGQGDNNDAIRFVDWMAENNIWPQIKPKVHSMNPAGRLRMERTIDRYFPT